MHATRVAVALGSLGMLGMLGCGDGAGAGTPAGEARIELVDVAAQAGLDLVQRHGDPRRWYILESNGSGAAWLDHDGDGDVDLFLGNGGDVTYVDDGRRLEVVPARSALYRNDGGLRFAEVGAECGAAVERWVQCATTGDVDNDGDPDLYLACFGADVLLRNDGGRFVDATATSGLGCELWGAGAAFADTDLDGDLDLYVANYCLFDPEHPPLEGQRNVIAGIEVGWGPESENRRGLNPGAPDRFYVGDGAGRFRDATSAAGLELSAALCSYAAVFSDIELDGDPDLLVANDMQPANLFVNDGHGAFADEAEARGFARDARGRASSAMGLAVEDFDGDGDFDVFRTNFDLEPNSLHVNDGSGRFADRAARHGLASPSLDRLGWGAAFLDVECDGDSDLLVANGHVYPQAAEIGMSGWLMQSQLYEAVTATDGATVYVDTTVRWGGGLAPLRSARGLSVADADDDGDLDAVIVDIGEPPRLLENRSARRGRWIAVRTVGSASNRDGLGAVVRVTAAGRTWTREVRTTHGLYSSHDPRLHFGLGEVAAVDAVEVSWPSGRRSRVERPTLGSLLVVHEPADGSE